MERSTYVHKSSLSRQQQIRHAQLPRALPALHTEHAIIFISKAAQIQDFRILFFKACHINQNAQLDQAVAEKLTEVFASVLTAEDVR